MKRNLLILISFVLLFVCPTFAEIIPAGYEQIGTWTIYSQWNESDECSCGSSISHQLPQGWNFYGEISINIMTIGFQPPSEFHTATCNSSDNNLMVLYWCSKIKKYKFHEKYYIRVHLPEGGSWDMGPNYAHPILTYDLCVSTQKEKEYCPFMPWTHICHKCSKDKNGNIKCDHKPACVGVDENGVPHASHGVDKSGNPIPCPFPRTIPPVRLNNEGAEPNCSNPHN